MEYLEIQSIKINSHLQSWNIIKFNSKFAQPFLKKSYYQSKVKSAYTMSSSQAGNTRGVNLKLNMQFQGILAEIVCCNILERALFKAKLFPNWRCIRYDDIRTDLFKTPDDEFDIKIQNVLDNNQHKIVESRSSIIKDRSLSEGIKNFDIIGPYSSKVKTDEGYVDFYIRPIYFYKNYTANDYDPNNFIEFFYSDLIDLYIVAGCSKEDMKKKGYNKDMKQDGTSYRAVKIINVYNAVGFLNYFIKQLNERLNEKGK